MQKKTRKKWPWIMLAIIVVLVAAFLILSNGLRSQTAQTGYNTHIVSSGSIEASVTGGGMLATTDTENIDLPDGIKIDDVLVQAGDAVDAGQILAVLNPVSLRNQAASLSDELSSLDKQLAQMKDSKTTEYVYAPVKGRIKYLPVAAHADVTSSIAEYGVLAILSTDDRMRVEIQTDMELELYAGVTVKWSNGKKKGEVTSKTTNGYIVTLNDRGTPYGETASIYDGETLIGSGVIEINKPVAVYANGGTISRIHYRENSVISANAKLFTLDNEPLSNSYQQTYSQRQELAEQLQAVITYINAPFVATATEGTISEVLVSDGNTTGSSESTSGKSTAFVMNKAGSLKMTVDVDELDIGSIILGQPAAITLDAISFETFEAIVTRISFLGTAKSNITTFAVELTLENDERFLPGMNGNATILVDKADDVLLAPIEAIHEDETGIYVYVSPSGTTDGSDRQRRDITTGLSDGEYAQITNGLSQGEIILYTRTASTAASAFPGMPGGMVMPGGTSGVSSFDDGGDGNED